MPATNVYLTVPPPTPRQSPFIKIYEKFSPSLVSPNYRPGIINNIDQVYELLELVLYLENSAAAANRTLQVDLNGYVDGDYKLQRWGWYSEAIIANSSCSMSLNGFGTIVGATSNLPGATIDTVESKPGSILLSGLDSLRLFVNNAQTGDTLEVFMLLKYLNHIYDIKEP